LGEPLTNEVGDGTGTSRKRLATKNDGGHPVLGAQTTAARDGSQGWDQVVQECGRQGGGGVFLAKGEEKCEEQKK